MTYHDIDAARWSLAGQVMAWTLAAETALALIVIAHPELHHPRVMVAAAAVMIASAGSAARTRMPIEFKAGLIAAVCAALLALAAVLDPFGLRAVDHRIETATNEAYDPGPQLVANHADTPVSSSSHIHLQGKGDASAAVFADDLAHSVAIKNGGDDGAYHVDGVIDVTAGTSGDSYRLTWSLGGQEDTVWCGRIFAIGQTRAAALDSLGTTIAAALRRARAGTMACS